MRRFKLPTPVFHFYTQDQSDAFLDAALRVEPAWYVLFLVGYRTGLRLGELIALEWGDVDLVTAKIHVRRSRTRNVTTTPKRGSRGLSTSPPPSWPPSAITGTCAATSCSRSPTAPISPGTS